VAEPPRRWHSWSKWKDESLLAVYLSAFTSACMRKATHCTFIDCFAGPERGVDERGVDFRGSPRVALSTKPEFTHTLFFELEPHAADLERSLRAEFPGRSIKVVAGDCNKTIHEGLAWLRDQGTSKQGPQLGPALAFLDPNAMELDWTTVEAIANWTGVVASGDFVRKMKTELLILFPTGPMRRTLPTDPKKAEASDANKLAVDRLFGDQEWRSIYAAQRAGLIKGDDSWRYYVEQYRLGLHRLGYSYTSAIEVRNTSNVLLYHIVFATGHDVGKKIMKAVQVNARAVLPAMVEDEKRGRLQSGTPMFETSPGDQNRYRGNQGRHAVFIDDVPRPFDPTAFSAPDEPDQLELFS
jgi:three-Cys-motif partner protein